MPNKRLDDGKPVLSPGVGFDGVKQASLGGCESDTKDTDFLALADDFSQPLASSTLQRNKQSKLTSSTQPNTSDKPARAATNEPNKNTWNRLENA